MATFGSVFLTRAAVPGVHPKASAIALTLWLIVGALVGCAASLAMVRTQPAKAVAGFNPKTDQVDFAGDAA